MIQPLPPQFHSACRHAWVTSPVWIRTARIWSRAAVQALAAICLVTICADGLTPGSASGGVSDELSATAARRTLAVHTKPHRKPHAPPHHHAPPHRKPHAPPHHHAPPHRKPHAPPHHHTPPHRPPHKAPHRTPHKAPHRAPHKAPTAARLLPPTSTPSESAGAHSDKSQQCHDLRACNTLAVLRHSLQFRCG